METLKVAAIHYLPFVALWALSIVGKALSNAETPEGMALLRKESPRLALGLKAMGDMGINPVTLIAWLASLVKAFVKRAGPPAGLLLCFALGYYSQACAQVWSAADALLTEAERACVILMASNDHEIPAIMLGCDLIEPKRSAVEREVSIVKADKAAKGGAK